MVKPNTSTHLRMGVTASIALLGTAATTVHAHAPPSCDDRQGMEYRYVLVHVTRRAKDAPPPTGSGDERIRIGYHPSPLPHIPLCSFIHEQDGTFSSSVPVQGGWLDIGGKLPGIRLHASVIHGEAIDIDVRPSPRTLTITRHADGRLMEEGTYRVSSHPFTLK